MSDLRPLQDHPFEAPEESRWRLSMRTQDAIELSVLAGFYAIFIVVVAAMLFTDFDPFMRFILWIASNTGMHQDYDHTVNLYDQY